MVPMIARRRGEASTISTVSSLARHPSGIRRCGRNTTPVTPPQVENYEDYHLTEDMADKAITWMRRHLAMNPDRPFLMWWTPGAVHGPHHVAKKWS